ncbi:Uncharacterised protein [Yokenella regensburgei]|nr:Uncharacterised protein [Yokenella regensburgei]
MHRAGFGFARFDKAQRLRNGHLVDKDLIFRQRRFRDPVTGLNDRRVFRAFSGIHPGHAGEELADRDGVCRVVCALIDNLQHIMFADHAGGKLDPTGAPAVGHRHFASAERNLITGDRHRFENGAANHTFGLLIKISKVVARQRISHDDPPVADVSAVPVQPGNPRSAEA